MTRYRLTFDPNPKELVRRDAAGSHVALLWSRRRHRAAVVVEEDATGELVELEVRERENPLELYQHAFAYLPTRGHPGTRLGARRPSDQAIKSAKEVTTMKKYDKHESKKDSRRDR